MKMWTEVMFQIPRKTYTLPLKGWLEDKSCQVLSQRLLLSFSRRPKARIVATLFSAPYSDKRVNYPSAPYRGPRFKFSYTAVPLLPLLNMLCSMYSPLKMWKQETTENTSCLLKGEKHFYLLIIRHSPSSCFTLYLLTSCSIMHTDVARWP